MSRFRLVALDIDGTVLNSAHQVTPALREALAGLAARGVRIVLCTGRRWRTALSVLRQLDGVDPTVVCAGGALIKHAADAHTLHSVSMSAAVARRALAAYRSVGVPPILLYDAPDDEPEMHVAEADRPRIERTKYFGVNRERFAFYDGAWPAGRRGPLVVFAVDEVESVRPAEGPVREAVGDDGIVTALMQPLYGAGQLALEVHDTRATKWEGLTWLLGRWGVAPEEVVAVGDDVNDVPMLEAAGLSFAMGNAPAEVKAAADRVTAGNDDEGVVRALETVFPR